MKITLRRSRFYAKSDSTKAGRHLVIVVVFAARVHELEALVLLLEDLALEGVPVLHHVLRQLGDDALLFGRGRGRALSLRTIFRIFFCC